MPRSSRLFAQECCRISRCLLPRYLALLSHEVVHYREQHDEQMIDPPNRICRSNSCALGRDKWCNASCVDGEGCGCGSR